MPDLAVDLVRHQAAVIVGNQQAIQPARAAAPTTPIVFVTGEDPVRVGLVASLSRPGDNLTGVTFFGGSQLAGKRMELLHQLVPKATVVAVFGDPGYPAFDAALPDLEAAARAMGLQILVVRVARSSEFEVAFTKVTQAVQAHCTSAAVLFSPASATRSLRSRRGMPFRQLTICGTRSWRAG